MGSVYLIIFIGFLLYNFNYFLSDQKESFLLGVIFLIVILIIILLVRKVTY